MDGYGFATTVEMVEYLCSALRWEDPHLNIVMYQTIFDFSGYNNSPELMKWVIKQVGVETIDPNNVYERVNLITDPIVMSVMNEYFPR